jgi:hypothetical protein
LIGIYLWGLVHLARLSVWAELGIAVLFPLVILVLGKVKPHSRRTLYLVGIETWFLLMVILSKFSIQYEFPFGNRIAKWGIAVFFVFQIGGFWVTQIRRKKLAGFLQSCIGALLILLLFTALPGTHTQDPDGRFLMWGAEVPAWMMAFYSFWVVNVLFSDSKRFPYISQVWVHLISVGIALGSGEFFHARLLTACHLFFLDIWLHYSIGEAPFSQWLKLPDAWHAYFERNIRDRLAWVLLVAVVGVAAWGLLEVWH